MWPTVDGGTNVVKMMANDLPAGDQSLGRKTIRNSPEPSHLRYHETPKSKHTRFRERAGSLRIPALSQRSVGGNVYGFQNEGVCEKAMSFRRLASKLQHLQNDHKTVQIKLAIFRRFLLERTLSPPLLPFLPSHQLRRRHRSS